MFDRSRAYRELVRGVLYEYTSLKESLTSLPERIATENARLTAIRSASAEGEAVRGGGGNVRQERDTATIAYRDSLAAQLKANRKDVEDIESALACLSENERRTVELFDIQRRRGALEQLMEELGYEKSKVYNIHNDALDKFSINYNGRK